MTVISSISSLPPLAVVRSAATQPAVGTTTESTAALSSPASIVTLHQDNNTINAQTYTSRGVIAEPDAPLAWEYTQPDKVSFRMGGNFGNASASARFRGLGETLLLQLAQSTRTSPSRSFAHRPDGNLDRQSWRLPKPGSTVALQTTAST